MRRLVAVVLLGTLLACKDQGPPPTPVVSGLWTGTGSGFSMTLTLSQNGQVVTGSGQISGSESIALTVSSGTYVHPNLSLTLTSPGFEPFNYSGEMSANNSNRVTGQLNGSGFQADALVLTRSP